MLLVANKDCQGKDRVNLHVRVGTFGSTTLFISHISIFPDPVEQERLLNSVITKLAEDSEYQQSTALARAYSLRARARADQKNWTFAMEDAKLVVLDNSLRQVATDACLSTAYRVWADAEDKLNSGKERVVAVLQHWQKAQPLYRTKLQREMQNKWTK